MSHNDTSRLARRGFLSRLSVAAAGLTTFATSRLLAEPSTAPAPSGGPDGWIDRLTGTDRLLFHTHKQLSPGLAVARNVLTNARDAYGVPEESNSVVVATHGPAISGLFRDDAWQRFAIGERYQIVDPRTGAPSTRNLFLEPQEGRPVDAVVTGLMKRGVIFLVCNVAVLNLAKRVAGAGGDVAAVHNELLAALLPGTVVVPDLFVAMSHAQKRGVSYIFVD